MKLIQKIWGIALITMGIAVIFRLQNKIPQLEQINININLIKISFYLISLGLIFGGIKKLFNLSKAKK